MIPPGASSRSEARASTSPGLPHEGRSRPEQTRRALTEAALELFAEKGYDATTVRDIVVRARVSRRTFFNHFAKENVLFAIDPVWLRQLQAHVITQPRHLTDVQAVRDAYIAWLVPSDLVELRRRRAVLLARAADSSVTLMGGQFRQHKANVAAVAEALATRKLQATASELDHLIATLAQTLVRLATDRWVAEEGLDIRELIADQFAKASSVWPASPVGTDGRFDEAPDDLPDVAAS